MRQLALCHTCQHQHEIDFDPTIGAGGAYSDWLVKHAGHRIEFRSPRRSKRDKRLQSRWDDYLHNADIKIAYASSAAYTITLASLAASASLVAGREGTAVDNTTNKYLDYLMAGLIMTSGTPTAGVIEVWCYANRDDTPTYPDVLDGTDSDETITSADIKNSALAAVAAMVTDGNGNRGYWFRPVSVAALYGGAMPKFHGPFVTHSTVAILHATGGNHVLSHTGVYATST